MRNKWQKEALARQAAAGEEEKKEEEEQKGDVEPDPELFRNILEGREELTDDNMNEMMAQWM